MGQTPTMSKRRAKGTRDHNHHTLLSSSLHSETRAAAVLRPAPPRPQRQYQGRYWGGLLLGVKTPRN